VGTPQANTWERYSDHYKFVGVQLYLNFDVIHATRTTYDLLALFGDIGGLNEVLGWIGVLLVGWYTDKNANGILNNLLFQQQKAEYKEIRTKQFHSEKNKE
jgi:hypothetical protein